MSLNSSRYFSNALVGTPAIGADIDVSQVDANPKFAVGFGFTRADGAKYRYGYASGGVSVGTVVAPTFASSGLATSSNNVIAPSSAVAVAGEVIAPGSVGSRYVEITLATVAAGQYKGGYLVIEDGSGAGYSYRIKNNTATGNPASGTVRIELYEPIKAVLSPNTDVTISPCLWNDLIAADVSTNVIVAGVAAGTTTSTYQYGWFCTKGVTSVLQDGTVVKGQGVMLSAVTAGAATLWGGIYTNVAQLLGLYCIGQCVAVGATTKYANVNLSID